LATTRTRRAEPALTASTAVRSALVPPRSVSPTSAVCTSRRRSSAFAISAAPCFSLKGYDVDAKTTASTPDLSTPRRQSMAAAPPIVTESSPQLATAFPGPPGLGDPPPITASGRRSMGTYAPYAVIPTIDPPRRAGKLRRRPVAVQGAEGRLIAAELPVS